MNANDQVEGFMLAEEIGAIRSGVDIESRRDDLVKILYANVQAGVEYWFNNRIQSLEQMKEAVVITFKDGTVKPRVLLLVQTVSIWDYEKEFWTRRAIYKFLILLLFYFSGTW